MPSRPPSIIQEGYPKDPVGNQAAAQPLVRFVGKAGPGAAKGKFGMVVSVEAQATRVGVDILESGGNAVDAAVAVALALAVTHPSAGNIGGGGFWLIHRKNEPTTAIDFRETAPASLDRLRFEKMIRSGGEGIDSVGVPGTIAGLFEAHKRYGKLPWNRLMLGPIRLAEKGHRVGLAEAIALRKAWPLLTTHGSARAIFRFGKWPGSACRGVGKKTCAGTHTGKNSRPGARRFLSGCGCRIDRKGAGQGKSGANAGPGTIPGSLAQPPANRISRPAG